MNWTRNTKLKIPGATEVWLHSLGTVAIAKHVRGKKRGWYAYRTDNLKRFVFGSHHNLLAWDLDRVFAWVEGHFRTSAEYYADLPTEPLALPSLFNFYTSHNETADEYLKSENKDPFKVAQIYAARLGFRKVDNYCVWAGPTQKLWDVLVKDGWMTEKHPTNPYLLCHPNSSMVFNFSDGGFQSRIAPGHVSVFRGTP